MANQPKMLIVDDEISTSNFLKTFFQRKGWIVYQAEEVELAKDILKKESPQVVLLDIRLKSQGCGIEILKEAKDISPESRFIVMSGSDASQQEALSLGAHSYFTKPVDMELLVKKINELNSL